MRTFGGRRAVAAARVPAASSVLAGLLAGLLLGPLTGCSAAVDRAHGVQTRLGRVAEVVDADVTTPSAARGPAISVTYAPTDSTRTLAGLVKDVATIADEEDYPSYRLDMVPSGSAGDRLVVDDAFTGGAREEAVLGAWVAATDALLGAVTYRYEGGVESIVVDAGAAVGHDVTEASRIGYGRRDTTWSFVDGDAVFVASGRVSPADVTLVRGVQRTVSSELLAAPAPAWRLERRDDHVRLVLDVALRGSPADPALLTVARYGADVGRLVGSALASARVARLPIWLQLRHRTAEGTDVFGSWMSGRQPLRGRDPLVRGWDAWLADLARPA